MPTKTISTQKSGVPITGATLLKVSDTPCVVFDIEGEVNSSAGTTYYIQLLGTASPSSGVTVPLYSRLCVPATYASGRNGFSFVYRPIGVDTAELGYPESATVGGNNTSPVYVAISSTNNVWTSVAASTQVAVTIEETYMQDAVTTIAGDLTTGVDSLLVFADPNANARLLRVQGSNSVATTLVPVYLMLFASVPVAGQLPLQQWPILSSNAFDFKFNNGLGVQSKGACVSGALPTDYTYHTGCYLYGSSTTQYFTATVGGKWNLKATYDTV